MKRLSVLTLSAAMSATLLLAGCASDQMKKDIADAKGMAQQAQAAADRAQRTADEAAAKADAAASAANSAQSCCNTNTERLDRMFRKAMSK
jgi:outer membrane murein-binding lipoprotein Lpp